MEVVLENIIDLLVGGITGIASGIGTGLASLVQSIFLEVGENGDIVGLSVFGGVIIVFAGGIYARVHSNMRFRSEEKTWKASPKGMLIRAEVMN